MVKVPVDAENAKAILIQHKAMGDCLLQLASRCHIEIQEGKYESKEEMAKEFLEIMDKHTERGVIEDE
jgi:hypothetical protein